MFSEFNPQVEKLKLEYKEKADTQLQTANEMMQQIQQANEKVCLIYCTYISLGLNFEK